MLVEKKNILQFIPQRFPIVMIDNLLEQEGALTVTDFRIVQENIFVRENEFQESGVFENIAQTAAAGAAWHSRNEKKSIGLNFIGAVNKLKIKKYPQTGDLLLTRTELITRVFNISLLTGRIFIENELIAECELKVVSEEKTE